MQKEAKKYVKRYRAFTLVEVILVAGTIALVAGALAGLVRYSYEDWKFGSSRSNLLQDGRAAIGQMVRILRQAKGFSAVSPPTDQAGDITFTDVDGAAKQFKLNTATSELEYGQPGSLSALTGSVSGLVFTCYDINSSALAEPVSAGSIQSVHIETTLADTENSFTLSGRVFCPTDLASGGLVTYEEFTEAKAGSNVTSITISTPGGTSEGDLLIAAVVTDGDTSASLALPLGEGWTLINLDKNGATLGVWWKLADASESPSHQFTWSGNIQAYGWIMRFTGHDPTGPINASAVQSGNSGSPTSPSVTTTVANTMVVRIGGFDDDDVTVDNPGLSGHTAITMDGSGTGTGTCSGGAGYVQKPAIGDSGTSDFSLTAKEQYVTVTIAIAPAP